MPKITKIEYNRKTRRVFVYIDNYFCAFIKRDVWYRMNLQEGSEISYDELRRKELSIWENFSS